VRRLRARAHPIPAALVARLTPYSPSGIIPAAQLQLRGYFLDPFEDFRYNAPDASLHVPLSSPYSQVLLISAYLSCVCLVRKHFNGFFKDSPIFLKLAVAHNLILALVSLLLLLMLSDQVS
jgi:hypothetical protein